MPAEPPPLPGWQFATDFEAARQVGGDFYDYFPLPGEEGRWGLVMADVSDTGVPAALFMALSRTLLKATAQFIADPTRCVAQLNDLLAAENDQMMFVTLFYGVLHLPTGQLQYVNAGHNPPYLLRADGHVEQLPRTKGMAVAYAAAGIAAALPA